MNDHVAPGPGPDPETWPGGETVKHPFGAFRRRIRVVNVDATTAVGGLEDDFHYFVVTVHHDGAVVTAIGAQAHRWPWTTCPTAGDRLQELVGMELSPRCLAVGDVTSARLQCTHQFDLAGLVIAHATRALTTRQYDVEIPYGAQSGGRVPVRLARDGVAHLEWTLDGPACVDPEPFANAPWRGGFLKWADATLPADDAEAAIVLRRACDIGLGRGADLESYPRAIQLAIGSSGVCYTFQPEVAAHSLRQIGTIRDWDDRVDEMLALGPFGPGAPESSGSEPPSPPE
ncbi:MAG: DUF2889 domain-containing protein [Actinobacteria bacterium]|nr:DUF2889 domain-containing protein [Actinomycetota bacterium]